jgi:hypothetical protein
VKAPSTSRVIVFLPYAAALLLVAWYQDNVLIVERYRLGSSLERRRLIYVAQRMVGGGSTGCKSPSGWLDKTPVLDACPLVAPVELASDVNLYVYSRNSGTACALQIDAFAADGTIYPCCAWFVSLHSTERLAVPGGNVSASITLTYPDCRSGLAEP